MDKCTQLHPRVDVTISHRPPLWNPAWCLVLSKRETRCSMLRWSGGANPPLHKNMFSQMAISRATHVHHLTAPPPAPDQMDFHARVCKCGSVVWFARRSLAALSCCWSKITVLRFINILRRIEELSGPWRGQERAVGKDCWVGQQFKQSRWINTNKPRRNYRSNCILFYFFGGGGCGGPFLWVFFLC